METARISSGTHLSVNFTANGMKICRNATRQFIFNSRPVHLTIATPLGFTTIAEKRPNFL